MCIRDSQSFFDNSFDRYPIGEKTEVADSEKRTPEAKFLFFKYSCFPRIQVFSTFLTPGLVNLVWFTVAKTKGLC